MHKFFAPLMMVIALLVSLSISFAQEERLQIVASHSILADVVQNVAGDAADVTGLMPLGADPHSFTPVPSDLVALADADVVFVNGAFFEEGLMEAIENAGDEMNLVTVSSCVQIIAFGGHDHDHEDHAHEGEDHEHEGDDHAHEEDDDHAHEEGEDHDHDAHEGEMGDMSAMAALCEQHYAEMEALHEAGHDHDHEGEDHEHEEHAHDHVETLGALYAIDCGTGHSHDHEGEDHDHEEGEEHAHDHGSCDSHVWTEPHNVMLWTMLIRDTLIELDPANAETYAANASTYLEAVDALAQEFIEPLVESLPESERVLVTNHEAFGYFAARYDFEIVGTIIPAATTTADPSAADIAALIDLIREEDVTAIFAETTVGDRIVQQISEETGAEVFALYSGSLSDADGPASTYLDYMRYNVTTIVETLGISD